MKRILAVCALLTVATVASAQPNLPYNCVRDNQQRPVFCTGVRPTVTAEMGIPVGTPFFSTSDFAIYYWSGSAWANSAGAGATVSFEGATADDFETSLAVTDPTADRTITLPDSSGTVLLSSTANIVDGANGFWVNTGDLKFEGSAANAFETTVTPTNPTAARTVTLADASGTVFLSTLATNGPQIANSLWGSDGRLDFEGTANDFETQISVTDPTADRLVTIPDTSGNFVIESALNYAIPDSGDGNPATYTLAPVGLSLATLSCLDVHGCTLTMGKVSMVAGASITIVQIAAGSGNITIVDDDGTTAELDGDANLVLNTLDSVTLHYVPANYWIETAYIDIT